MFFVGLVWCLIPASKILNRHLLMILKITDTPFFFCLIVFYFIIYLFIYFVVVVRLQLSPFFTGNCPLLLGQWQDAA